MTYPTNDNFAIESSQYLRIPTRRIGAVIGIKGANKENIEEKTKTIIIIDSDTGEVEVRPGKDLKDPVQLFNARDIVKAIGRGFSIEQAINLANDDYYLEIISLKTLVGDKSNHLTRVRSRLIGTQGKTRKSLEELTKCSMMVSGSTVSLIGNYEQLSDAKTAVMDIINGAQIESVIGKLEDKKKKLKKSEKTLWKSEEEIKKEKLVQAEDPFEDYEE